MPPRSAEGKAAVALAISAGASDLWTLTLWRAATGLVQCAPFMLGLAYIGDTVPLVVYPNHGATWDGDHKCWIGPIGGSELPSYVLDWTAVGARMIGGCCGVGADGIRSRIRQLLWPSIEPRYSGFGVWRSVHRRPPELGDKIMMMAPGLRLGIMPISDNQLYLFGTVPEAADAWFDRADWPALMQSRFAVFRGPAAQFLDDLNPRSEVLYTAVEEVVMPGP